ncbi:uroporphyrinogen decarboxylase family protein [Clostridium sp. WLY-B-L2]|uniref:Uroporphyrinogen decarboxylase family protein n=1 Tax=Clostridium aromativorans TaxID=2836848 RepID=A0ABS8N7R5_9CLOT|nr:uroporphyrinogen decarboxylase family protein [Clostridium aromativorans]MCC9295853.1 uroporphyrinogen decarboxylase family protein [Clostridium aromativorans]
MRDKMTPMERASALAKGKDVDRLSCNPNIANGVARIYGCKISDFNTGGKAIAESQIAAYRRFGMDGVRVFTDLYVWAEAMGAELVLPEDNTADLLKPALEDVKDIDKLKVANPYKDGRLPVFIEAMKYLVDAIGKEVPCSGGIVGPFSNAFFLIGVDKMTRLLLKNPEAVHKLCKISLENCIEYTKVIIENGLTPTISEPLASCTVVNPKHFREFCAPYLKELVRFIKSKGSGCTLHICGNTKKIWNDVGSMAEDGVTGFSMDNVVSLAECSRTIGDKMKILGNVDPSGIMYAGTRNDIRNAVVEAVEEGYNTPKGYVVMSGCSLPVETPFENIQTMMDTVREIGYPVNVEKLEKMKVK